MHTRFILIQTSHAGNVGAAARAMKTMGFDYLVLVAPRWPNVLRREETIQRASGALDVLEKCRIVDTLDEALEGVDHLCATAMTPRDFGPPTRWPREHFAQLMAAPAAPTDAAPSQPAGVAFLFGSERFGMCNEDVYRCHACLSIPSNPAFGSLNIGAALQVIAYEWRLALGGFGAHAQIPARSSAQPPSGALADAAQVAGMLTPKKLMPRLNQLFNRASVTEEEIHILRGIAKAVVQQSTFVRQGKPLRGADAGAKG